MNDNLKEFIAEEADDFSSRIVNGSIQYDGRWRELPDAIDCWVEYETEKFSSALRGALDTAASVWEIEEEQRQERIKTHAFFAVGDRVYSPLHSDEGDVIGLSWDEYSDRVLYEVALSVSGSVFALDDDQLEEAE